MGGAGSELPKLMGTYDYGGLSTLRQAIENALTPAVGGNQGFAAFPYSLYTPRSNVGMAGQDLLWSLMGGTGRATPLATPAPAPSISAPMNPITYTPGAGGATTPPVAMATEPLAAEQQQGGQLYIDGKMVVGPEGSIVDMPLYTSYIQGQIPADRISTDARTTTTVPPPATTVVPPSTTPPTNTGAPITYEPPTPIIYEPPANTYTPPSGTGAGAANPADLAAASWLRNAFDTIGNAQPWSVTGGPANINSLVNQGAGVWGPQASSTGNQVMNALSGYMAPQGGMFPGFLDTGQGYINQATVGMPEMQEFITNLLFNENPATSNIASTIAGLSGYMSPQGGMFPGYLNQAQSKLDSMLSGWPQEAQTQALDWINQSGNPLAGVTGGLAGMDALLNPTSAAQQIGGLPAMSRGAQEQLNTITPQYQNLLNQALAAMSGANIAPQQQQAQNLIMEGAPGLNEWLQLIAGSNDASTANLNRIDPSIANAGLGQATTGLEGLLGNVQGAQAPNFDLSKLGQGANIFNQYAQPAQSLIQGANAPSTPSMGAGPTGLETLRSQASGGIPGVQSATSSMYNALSEAQSPQMWNKAGQGIEGMLAGGKPTDVSGYQQQAGDLTQRMQNVSTPSIFQPVEQGVRNVIGSGLPTDVSGSLGQANQLFAANMGQQAPNIWNQTQQGVQNMQQGGTPINVSSGQTQMNQLANQMQGLHAPDAWNTALQQLQGIGGAVDTQVGQNALSTLAKQMTGQAAPDIWGQMGRGIGQMAQTGMPTDVSSAQSAIYNAAKIPFEDQMANLRESMGQQGLRYSQPLMFEEGRQRERFATDIGSQMAQLGLQSEEAARARQQQAYGQGMELGGLQGMFGQNALQSAFQPTLASAQMGNQAQEDALQRQLAAAGQMAGVGGQQAAFGQQNLAQAMQPLQFGGQLGFQAGENAAQRQIEGINAGVNLGGAQQQAQLAGLQASMQPLQFGANLGFGASEAARGREQQAIEQAQALGGQQAAFPRENLMAAMQPLQFGAQYPLQATQTEAPLMQYGAEFPMQQAQAQVPWAQMQANQPLQQAQAMANLGQTASQFPFQEFSTGMPAQQFASQFPFQQAQAGAPLAQAIGTLPMEGLGAQTQSAAAQAAATQSAMQNQAQLAQMYGQMPLQQASALQPWAGLQAGTAMQQAAQLPQWAQQYTDIQQGNVAGMLPYGQANQQMAESYYQNMLPYLQMQQNIPLQQAQAAMPWVEQGLNLPLDQLAALLPYQQQQIQGLQGFANAAQPYMQMQSQLPLQQAGAMQPWTQMAANIPLQQAAALQPYQQQQIQGLNQFANTSLPFMQELGGYGQGVANALYPWEQYGFNSGIQQGQAMAPIGQNLAQYPLDVASQAMAAGLQENQLNMTDLNAIYQDWLRRDPQSGSNPMMQLAIQYAMGIPGATQTPTTPWGSIAGAGGQIGSALIKAFSGCFHGGTEVALANLDIKEMQDLVPGDILVSDNLEGAEVIEVLKYDENPIMCLNGVFMKDHPIYKADGTLAMASKLGVGDKIWGCESVHKLVTSCMEGPVFNVVLGKGHDYYVLSDIGWMRVHNGRDYGTAVAADIG